MPPMLVNTLSCTESISFRHSFLCAYHPIAWTLSFPEGYRMVAIRYAG